MGDLSRIDGCKGRLIFKLADAQPADPELAVVDMTSFTWNRTSEISTFKTLNNCAQQTGEGSTAYTISGDGIYATQDPGQSTLKEGRLVQWGFYPDYNDIGEPDESRVGGIARVESLDLSVSTDDNHQFSFSATGEGDYTATNMW